MFGGPWRSDQRRSKSLLLSEAVAVILIGLVEVFRRVEAGQGGGLAVDALAGMLLLVLGVLLLRQIFRLAQAGVEAELYRVRLQETRGMIDALRAQRHDFLNHLQVIYGLIQVGRTEAIKEHIKMINQEVHNNCFSSLVSGLSHRPEIAGLVMRKMAQAEAANIPFSLELRTDLAMLGVPALDFCRMLGNLLDNALDAVQGVPPEDRRISLIMDEDEQSYLVEVVNYRPLIPGDNRERIFQKGFTTKKDKGEGLGLYIVKTLTEKHRGKVQLHCSEERGTCFSLSFPKVLPGSNC